MESLNNAANALLLAVGCVTFGYLVLLDLAYLVLAIMTTALFLRQQRRLPFAGTDRIFASPLTPAVSVVIAAHDEQARIVRTVRAMLGQRYPALEVVVVDDGSTDGTFERLRAEFGLVEVPAAPGQDVPVRGAVRCVHLAAGRVPLTVVRKESVGRRADALNAGINAARNPLVCLLPAGALAAPDLLLHLAKPFVDDPWHVVATGSAVRPAANGQVEGGRLVAVRMPRSWRARTHIIGYMRAYLLGRSGWGRLGGMLVASLGFGMYRRESLVEATGLDPDRPAAEADLLARLRLRVPEGMPAEQRRERRAVFVVATCWTERPMGGRALPPLPRMGLTEALGPVLGAIGFVALLGAYGLGLIGGVLLAAYVLAWLGYATTLAAVMIIMQELNLYQRPRWRDLGASTVAAVLDSLGYRRTYAWWRWRGIIAATRNAPPRATPLPTAPPVGTVAGAPDPPRPPTHAYAPQPGGGRHRRG